MSLLPQMSTVVLESGSGKHQSQHASRRCVLVISRSALNLGCLRSATKACPHLHPCSAKYIGRKMSKEWWAESANQQKASQLTGLSKKKPKKQTKWLMRVHRVQPTFNTAHIYYNTVRRVQCWKLSGWLKTDILNKCSDRTIKIPNIGSCQELCIEGPYFLKHFSPFEATLNSQEQASVFLTAAQRKIHIPFQNQHSIEEKSQQSASNPSERHCRWLLLFFPNENPVACRYYLLIG